MDGVVVVLMKVWFHLMYPSALEQAGRALELSESLRYVKEGRISLRGIGHVPCNYKCEKKPYHLAISQTITNQDATKQVAVSSISISSKCEHERSNHLQKNCPSMMCVSTSLYEQPVY